jgi:hypothetical protein
VVWCSSTALTIVPRRRGVAEYWCWTRDDECAQDDGAVRRHGGVDGRSDKVNAGIPLGDGFEEEGGSDFYGMCNGVR